MAHNISILMRGITTTPTFAPHYLWKSQGFNGYCTSKTSRAARRNVHFDRPSVGNKRRGIKPAKKVKHVQD